MRNNNFDTSSSGINIEFQVFYDNNLSQWDFNDNFKRLEGYSTKYNSKEESWFYIDNGNLNDDNLGDFKTSGKVKDYKKLEAYNGYEIAREDYDNASDYKQDVMIELVANEGFRNAVKIAQEFDIKLDFKNDIRIIEIRGYSQGDYAEVYADFTQMQKVWGKIPSESELSDIFTHYFYDAPITGCITINGEEYPYEFDTYDFKRDEWINQVAGDNEYIKDWLNDNLPTQLDYN